MGIFSLMNSSVTGMKGQGEAMAHISDNLANVGTTAFKGTDSDFFSMVSQEYSGGGVRPYDTRTINIQGGIETSAINTNIAIDGHGMFLVQAVPDEGQEVFFTRSGAFSEDKHQRLVNGEGHYLMGWSLKDDTITPNDKPVVDQLEVINLTGLGVSAVATTKMSLNLNLDAEQEVLTGVPSYLNLDSKYNRIDFERPLIPASEGVNDAVRIGDGFSITTSTGDVHNFVYSGLVRGAKVDSNIEVLGANSIYEKFSTLREGDKFIINTISSGDTVFTYTANSPDVRNGFFNNMNSLVDAIDTHELFSANLVDGSLYIAPNDASEKMTFSNASGVVFDKQTKNTTGLFGQDFARNSMTSLVASSTNTIFGAPDSATVFSTGINDGDSFAVVLSDGSTSTFSFKGTISAAASGEFNSLATLKTALDAMDGVSAAIVNNNQLKIDSTKALMSITSNDVANITGALGITINPTFRTDVTRGDKMIVEVGSFDTVSSVRVAATNVLNAYSNVKSIDPFQNSSFFGAVNTAGILTDLTAGQGITIRLDSGTSQSFTYNVGTLGANEFNSIDTLITAINANANFSAVLDNGAIFITSGSGGIATIAELNGTTLAEDLGIKIAAAAVNDTLDITLDTADSISCIFVGSGPVDITNNEFNSIQTLADVINDNFNSKLSADIVDDSLVLTPGSKFGGNIRSITGNVASALGMEASTSMIEMRFNDTNPDVNSGEFNDLVTLNNALNISNKFLQSTIDDQGKTIQLTSSKGAKIKYITNENVNGGSDFATTLGLAGADIVTSLGFNNDYDLPKSSESSTFASLAGLRDLINDSEGIGATIRNNKMGILPDNVMDTVAFTNLGSNVGDMVRFFDLPTIMDTPSYDALDSSKNMASGSIDPQFYQNMRVYDSLGSTHQLRFAFVKLDTNKWVVEVYTPDKDEINTTRSDGLLGYAKVEFNGDGTLHEIDFTPTSGGSINSNVINVNWQNGSEASAIDLDLGMIDPKTKIDDFAYVSGLRQFSANFVVDSIDQDGTGVGRMSHFHIDEDGCITASFTNGTSKKVYKVPIAEFPNINGLRLVSGNLYTQSTESGDYLLRGVSEGKVGRIIPNATESSNVELFDQLVKLIVARHISQSNLKALQTADRLLDDINKIL